MNAPAPATAEPDSAADAAELQNAAIRDGHRRLLLDYRECIGLLDREGGTPHPAEVRALVSFLRESLFTFARWEEGCLEPGSERAEDTAFEHAFLQAETDALGAAVAAYASPGVADDVWADGVRKLCHRIEAVLELHVLKAEDRDTGGVVTLDPPRPLTVEAPSESPRGRGPRELEQAEISDFLKRSNWGILATVGEDMPYAVPVSYGWDGRFVYLACAPGQKARYLESEPTACLTVADVESTDRWRSVVARGRVRWITSGWERMTALRVLHRQRGEASPTLRDLARMATARFACLEPAQLTGRTRG